MLIRSIFFSPIYAVLEPRALLNLDVEQNTQYFSSFLEDLDYDDGPNGFVFDNTGTGLVYWPEAAAGDESFDRPSPLNQSKSDKTVVDATVQSEIRLRRLLANKNIELALCDLNSNLVFESYLITAYMDKTTLKPPPPRTRAYDSVPMVLVDYLY